MILAACCVPQNLAGSSFSNLHYFALLFGLDMRSLRDPHMYFLIANEGLSKEAREYMQTLKPLKVAYDVVLTY